MRVANRHVAQETLFIYIELSYSIKVLNRIHFQKNSISSGVVVRASKLLRFVLRGGGVGVG